ncbi:MAG: hypothetical protein U0270_10305 [Labilithrix sp.]
MKTSLVLAAVTLAAAACAVHAEGGTSTSEIRELERRIVGPPQPYPADTLTAEDEARFATSKKARRALGWHVLAKALAPVAVANVPNATIPKFRTWLGGDELERMFGKMYADLGPARRKAKALPTPEEVNAVFDWASTSLGPSSEQDYFDRLAQVSGEGATKIDGLGGNARVAYSPSYVRQYLTDYPTIADCDLDALSFDSAKTCFSQEFPSDAAVIKTSWRRNDPIVADGLPVVDTSARALETVDAWSPSKAPLQKAGPEDAYSVTMSDDAGYSLVGLHIMTKELRHWVWVTVWWSPNDDDFGADRPEEITKLGAPWTHYKMSVVTDFEEKDPDPRGGFDGSLGDALAAVHGPSTWTSNPFLEKGAHNAQTNCIGCHQHAGDPKVLDAVLDFPEAGRSLVRQSFPADYSWAFATPPSPDPKDRLQDALKRRIKAYAHE